MLHILTSTYRMIEPWFDRPPCPIELDMGCGKGRFTLELARRYPERLILASDIMLGRLRHIEARLERQGIPNVELLRANHQELAGFQLPDNSVRRLHLLCPDPWPKARHRWRRVVTTDFLNRVARILEPGGILHLATDHPPYAETLRNVVAGLPVFQEEPESIADIADLKTGFEVLWLSKNRHVPHLAFRCNKS
jgi:tRNA (guanine-N7-)-methyltransferase